MGVVSQVYSSNLLQYILWLAGLAVKYVYASGQESSVSASLPFALEFSAKLNPSYKVWLLFDISL